MSNHNSSVGIVTPSFYPFIGGVELYVQNIGRELARLGYEVHIYTPDSVMGRKVLNGEEKVDSLHVHRVHVSVDLSYRLRLWPGLRSELERGRHDLVHVYSQDTYALPASLAADKQGAVFLLTTYGPLSTHSDYSWLEAGIFRAYDKTATRYLFRRSGAVLVRYPELAGWVESFDVPPARILLEPSGIERGNLALKDGSRFRDKIGHDGPLVLYVGRLTPQKGLEHAVDAMIAVTSEFPDAKLVLVGPDYAGYGPQLEERALSLGIPQSLIIYGPISDNEFEAEAIASCDVFIMPSRFEGFSQAVLKALAQGKPVVVSQTGGLPYEVGYGECGLLCKFRDSNALANSIIRLLVDEDLCKRIGDAGRKRAGSFTFDRLGADLASTYNRFLENS